MQLKARTAGWAAPVLLLLLALLPFLQPLYAQAPASEMVRYVYPYLDFSMGFADYGKKAGCTFYPCNTGILSVSAGALLPRQVRVGLQTQFTTGEDDVLLLGSELGWAFLPNRRLEILGFLGGIIPLRDRDFWWNNYAERGLISSAELVYRPFALRSAGKGLFLTIGYKRVRESSSRGDDLFGIRSQSILVGWQLRAGYSWYRKPNRA